MDAAQKIHADQLAVPQPTRSDGRPSLRRIGDPEGTIRVRCCCTGCGAHVQAVVGVRIYGQCSNCGGVNLVPLEPLVWR